MLKHNFCLSFDMAGLNRYKPRIHQEGNPFWKKYLSSKAERAKKEAELLKKDP